jgi:hypothetical protein
MLPPQLHKYQIPDDPQPGRSIAEALIVAYEENISTHLTAETLPPLNKRNIMAAIRDLRNALAPFVTMRMDMGTVDVLLGGFLGTLGMFKEDVAEITLRRVDKALADHLGVLARTTIPPQSTRNRKLLNYRNRLAFDAALQPCSVAMTRAEKARFNACALDAAGIPHDDPEAHADRLVPKAE